jgi:cytochrome b
VARYLSDILRNRPTRHDGHNPAGGYMIVLMLVCLTLVVATGFMQLSTRFSCHGWDYLGRDGQYKARRNATGVPGRRAPGAEIQRR